MELKRGQNGFTLLAVLGASRSAGRAFFIVASHAGCQVSSSPRAAFCSAIGVEGAGFSIGVAPIANEGAAASERPRSLRNATSPAAKQAASRQIAIRNVLGIRRIFKDSSLVRCALCNPWFVAAGPGV